MSAVRAKLAELGLELPEATTPLAAYVPAVRTGNLVFTAGQLPFVNGKLPFTGKIGAEVSVEQAKELAKIAALNCLSAVETVASIDDVVQIVRVVGYINGAPGFVDQSAVVNGASELFVLIFGEAGKHARSSIGVAELPMNAPIEIELTVELRG